MGEIKQITRKRTRMPTPLKGNGTHPFQLKNWSPIEIREAIDTTMKKVIRIEDTAEYGISVRKIFGFSIFGYNRVTIPLADEPILRFLQSTMHRLSCSAHIGPIGFGGLEAMEIFGPPKDENRYTFNRVGLSGRHFYSLDGEFHSDHDACFFSHVRTSFLGAEADDFYDIIGYDALALMIGASPETEAEQNALFTTVFPGHETWLRKLTAIYDVVVLTGADADFIVAWARTPEMFAVLDESIMVAENTIRNSKWYQQHEQELVWDGEFGMCYVIPEK